MNANTKSLLKAVGLACISFMLLNFIIFGIELMMMDLSEQMRVSFTNGTFYINGETNGLIWGDRSGSQFLIGVFLLSLIIDYKNGLLFKNQASSHRQVND